MRLGFRFAGWVVVGLLLVAAVPGYSQWTGTHLDQPFLAGKTGGAGSGGGTIPGIFVDSVAGSDSNAGTSNAPFATLGKVTTIVNGTATNIYLKRGSYFQERWLVPTNVTIDCYGTVGYAPSNYAGVVNSKPVVTGATNLRNAGFSLTGGKTKTYQFAITVPSDVNPDSLITTNEVLMVWENNVRLGGIWITNAGRGSTANVEANAGSFWYDKANSLLYIHLADDGNPISNSKTYEASIRTGCLCGGGDGSTVRNIICEKAYASTVGNGEGYGIKLWGGVGALTVSRCRASYGWSHNLGTADSIKSAQITFDSCRANDAAGGTLFVAYKDGPSYVANVLFTNCLADMAQTNLSIQGYLTHDAGGTATISTSWKNCYALNLNQGWSWNGVGRCAVFSGNTAEACFIGVDVTDNQPIVNFTNYFHPKSGGGATAIELESGTTSNAINSCKFIFTNDAAGITLGGVAVRGYVTNCIFGATGTRAGTALNGVGGPIYNCWSNTFVNVTYGYINGTYTGGSGDYNNYFTTLYIGDMECCSNPSPQFWTQANLSGWKTAWAGVPVDQNATATDPGYAAGFYTFTMPDPTGGDAN